MNNNLQEIFYRQSGKSGPGSTIEYTKTLRFHLPIIIDKFNVKTLLDAPCGDLVWMSTILKNNNLIEYIGGDIVKKIVDKHSHNYKNCSNIRFVHIDITEDKLPNADLWIIRDVLFHLSPDNIQKVFQNLKQSNIKYVLTTTHHEDSIDYNGNKWVVNKPIINGEFELLNLFADPYNLPQPIYRFDDTYGPHPKREMCLWEVEQLKI